MDKSLAVLCARSGSKGIPNKNVRSFLGYPLIFWALRAAVKSNCFTDILVSSDSSEILDIAEGAGATSLIKRPLELATDTANVHDAIIHAIDSTFARKTLTNGSITILQATSPLVQSNDLIEAKTKFDSLGLLSLVSACISDSSPYYDLLEYKDDGSLGVILDNCEYHRRQDIPASFKLNGAFFMHQAERYLERPRSFYNDSVLHLMPKERSIDIDDEFDWICAVSVAEKLKL